MLLLKHAPTPDLHAFDRLLDDDDALSGIRCPLCGWRPSAASRWSCSAIGTPEPFFEGCGTIWNTFSTAGRCPGCSHQWQWTSCLQCEQWSPHADWYEENGGGDSDA